MTLAFARILDAPLAAWLRARPEWRGEPLVVLDVDEHASPEARLRAPVRSASLEAMALGVRPGLTGAQARSIAPEARAVVRSSAQEKAMASALRDAAWSISPVIEPAGDGVYVDLSGLGRLHPSSDDAARALARAARDVDIPVSVGVASSKPLASLKSRHGAGAQTRRVDVSSDADEPLDPELEFLRQLPIQALADWVPSLLSSGRSDDAAALMAAFGARTIGDVAVLPRGALTERIGRDGELIERLARGEHRPPLEPARPAVTFEEGLELEGYLETFEPLGFMLRPAIERLMGRLVLRGLGCSALEIHLSLDPSGVDARTVTVAVPTRDVTALLALVRLSMDARPPDAPVDGFRVIAHAGELRPTQLSLFAPAGPAPGALATTLARLSALVGPDRLGSPRVPWTRRPGVVETSPFEPGPPPLTIDGTPERCPVRAMRRVSPPLPVEIERDAHGRLCAVILEGQRRGVLRAEGPYVVEGGWWSEEAYGREEHDVTLMPRRYPNEGALKVRLVREGERHLVDAVYD